MKPRDDIDKALLELIRDIHLDGRCSMIMNTDNDDYYNQKLSELLDILGL